MMIGKIRRRNFKNYDDYLMAVINRAAKNANRITHLALRSKKRRVRKKNWLRMERW